MSQKHQAGKLPFRHFRPKADIEIIDFGDDQMCAVVGTPYYVSTKGNYDKQCDIWSLWYFYMLSWQAIPLFW